MSFKFYQETNFKQTDLGPLPQVWKVVRLGEVPEIFSRKRTLLNEKQLKYHKGVYPTVE